MSTALLLSGGMDSTALAYLQRPDIAITIDYGQIPADAEIRAASAVAAALGIHHEILRLPYLRILGSGDLAGSAQLSVAPKSEWWPFRNQLLVSIAAGALLATGVRRLLIGTLVTDNHHSDGSPEFVGALDQLLSMQEGGIRLEAPAIELTAAGLVRASKVPMEVLAWSHSCHRADFACGECRGCRKHYRTMEELGELPY